MKAIVALLFSLAIAPVWAGEPIAAEPGICKKLVASREAGKDLVNWLLDNGTELKQKGCWQSYTRLGEEGLAEATRQKRLYDRARIALSISSVYFYQGQFDECQKIAEEARGYAQSHDKWSELIESYYLLSAVARVKSENVATSLIDKAMSVLDAHEPGNDFLRAKLLYNLGAAYTDLPKADYDKARENLQKALKLYTRLGNNYEVVRTGLRLARVDYLQGEYVRGLATLQRIEAHLDTPRIRMLYHYQLAKILHKLDKWEQSEGEARKALDMAKSLGAKVDEQRAEALLTVINRNKHLGE